MTEKVGFIGLGIMGRGLGELDSSAIYQVQEDTCAMGPKGD